MVLALGGCGAAESVTAEVRSAEPVPVRSAESVPVRSGPEVAGVSAVPVPSAAGEEMAAVTLAAATVVEGPPSWVVTVPDEPPLRVRYRPWAGLVPPGSAVRSTEYWTNRERTTVLVGSEAIGVAGAEVLRLVDGRIPAAAREGHEIAALRKGLRRVFEFSADVVFLVDHRVRFADLVDVLFTASRAGAVRWLLAIRAPGDAPGTTSGVLELAPAQFSSGMLPDDEAPPLHVIGFDRRELALLLRIEEEAVEVGELVRSGDVRVLGRVARTDGWGPVQRIAREAASRDAADVGGVVVFGAGREVRLERVVEALVAVQGPRCAGSRSECWFGHRILVGGDVPLRGLGAGRGAVTITEGEWRSRHAGAACSASIGPGGTLVSVGAEIGEMDMLTGKWLEVAEDRSEELEVWVTPPWRAKPRWDAPSRAIHLTKTSGCARFEVELGRHAHHSEQPEPVRGSVDLDCALGEVTVRGRLGFRGCNVWTSAEVAE